MLLLRLMTILILFFLIAFIGVLASGMNECPKFEACNFVDCLTLQLHVHSLTQTPVASRALSRQWTLIVFLVSRLRTCHKHLMTLIGAINDFIMGTDSSCSLQKCPLQCTANSTVG